VFGSLAGFRNEGGILRRVGLALVVGFLSLLSAGCGPSNRLGITTPTLSSAEVNVPYQETIRGGGGSSPYTFTVVEGALPPGLSLDSDGRLSGTPTQQGSFPFKVRVRDARGREADRQLTLHVR